MSNHGYPPYDQNRQAPGSYPPRIPPHGQQMPPMPTPSMPPVNGHPMMQPPPVAQTAPQLPGGAMPSINKPPTMYPAQHQSNHHSMNGMPNGPSDIHQRPPPNAMRPPTALMSNVAPQNTYNTPPTLSGQNMTQQSSRFPGQPSMNMGGPPLMGQQTSRLPGQPPNSIGAPPQSMGAQPMTAMTPPTRIGQPPNMGTPTAAMVPPPTSMGGPPNMGLQNTMAAPPTGLSGPPTRPPAMGVPAPSGNSPYVYQTNHNGQGVPLGNGMKQINNGFNQMGVNDASKPVDLMNGKENLIGMPIYSRYFQNFIKSSINYVYFRS